MHDESDHPARHAPRPLDAGEIPDFEGRPERGLFAIERVVDPSETSRLVPHANNVTIVGWIDDLASRAGDAAGASRADLGASGRMWFVARHDIRYLGEAFVGDRILCATWCPSVGRTSLVRESRLIRASDGTVLVAATSRWAHVDLASRRPTPMAPAIRAALAGESSRTAGGRDAPCRRGSE